MPDSDDPAVILAGIRERAAAAADLPLAEFARLIDHDARTVAGWIAASALDVPRLVALVDAVLELADRWTLRPGDPDWARTRAMDECAGKLREAIARELTAERGDSA